MLQTSGYLVTTFRIQREILYPKAKPTILRKTPVKSIELFDFRSLS